MTHGAAIGHQRRDVFRVGDRRIAADAAACERLGVDTRRPCREDDAAHADEREHSAIGDLHRAKSAMKQPTACVVAMRQPAAGEDRCQRVGEIVAVGAGRSSPRST